MQTNHEYYEIITKYSLQYELNLHLYNHSRPYLPQEDVDKHGGIEQIFDLSVEYTGNNSDGRNLSEISYYSFWFKKQC